VQNVVTSAVGGENITTTIEGRERYPVNVRYARDYRSDLTRLIRQEELLIGQALRGGVLLSAGVIVVGVVLYFVRAFATPHGVVDPPNPRSLTAVFSGLMRGDPVAVVSLGLLLLVATPVVNVLVSMVSFALQRDRRYVIIASLVLLILLISFALGKGGA